MISKQKILEVLNEREIILNQAGSDQRVYRKACDLVYKSIPIPWRWIVGKKRIENDRQTERIHRVGVDSRHWRYHHALG